MNKNNFNTNSNVNSDIIYVDVRINHNPGLDIEQPNIVTYNNTRTQPIVEDISKYYVAVVSATVPCNEIPLTIAKIVPNQPNPNKMTNTISINYLGVPYIEFLNYIPYNSYAPPVQNKTIQVTTPYYYIYSAQAILNYFNNALALCFASAAIPGLVAPTDLPYFKLNASTQLIELIVSQNFINSGALIQVNSVSQEYLQGFAFEKSQPIAPLIYTFLFDANGNVCDYNGYPDSTGTYRIYTQEYVAFEAWTILKKIIIATDSIAVGKEVGTATPQTNNISNISLNILNPILLDYYPETKNISDYRCVSHYDSQNQYRLNVINGSGPLYNITISVKWADNAGNVYDLYQSVYKSTRVKLGFFKKSLYNNNLEY